MTARTQDGRFHLNTKNYGDGSSSLGVKFAFSPNFPHFKYNYHRDLPRLEKRDQALDSRTTEE